MTRARPADADGEKQRPRRSAILVMRDDRGRVLLVRQRGGPFEGAWLLPGGGLEDGESFEDAVRREVREETGLIVTEAREIARYDVRAPRSHSEVAMYVGTASGELAPGEDGWPVWTEIGSDAHPVLLRELIDADVVRVPTADVERRLGALGIRMERIGR